MIATSETEPVSLSRNRSRHWRLAVVVAALVLTGLVWVGLRDREVGWTGLVLADPVQGPVEVRDDGGRVVAQRASWLGQEAPTAQEEFQVGLGHYTVVTCVGSRGEQSFSAWVLPGFHTIVWDQPRPYRGVFVGLCTGGGGP